MAAASCVNFDSEFFNKYTTRSYYLSRGASGNVYGPIQWDNIQLALKQVTFADGKVTDAVKKDIAVKKQIWISFEHKHLTKIQCVDLSQLPKMMFIVMEFAAGGSLYKTLRSLGSENKLPVDVVTVWAKQIAEGMLYLHQKDIVHRDLKSANILLVKPFDVRNPHMTMTLKITDFDEVKELDHTTTLSLVGTCAYMAPEVCVNQRFSKASDVWSFGVVIWEMLSGNIPHKGLKQLDIMHKAHAGKLENLPIEQSFPENYRLFLKTEGKDVTEILKYKGNMLQKYFRVTRSAEVKGVTEIGKYKGNMLRKYFQVPSSGRPALKNGRLLFGRKGEPPRTTVTLQDTIISIQLHVYDLPMEMLDVILQKSYLHWILNTKPKQRDEEVIRSLISVDVCFNRRITRQRFKKAIWRYLKNFYEKTMKRSALIRNNRNYLLETIQPSDEFISSLLSFNCVTEEQQDSIQSQRSKRVKNAELLQIMRSFNETKFSYFVKCLQQNNQSEVAKILSTGGVGLMCPISTKINFTQRIKLPCVCGVTKLGNEIFVLYQEYRPVICVFEDRHPFRFRRKIKIKQIKRFYDMGSSEKNNCLYVSDWSGHCIWKITKEKGDEYKVMKWLTTDHLPCTISVTIDGNLLMVNDSSTILRIFDDAATIRSILKICGSDAAIIRSIHLPSAIGKPIHAVETSIGNFIILHAWTKKISGLNWTHLRYNVTKWVVSELTRDGQEVIRRFIPANNEQELIEPCHMSLDSDDRVFVADGNNGRVILLDSDLQWNQNIYPPEKQLKADKLTRNLWRLCYDKENKQLIVVEYEREVTIYTLSQN